MLTSGAETESETPRRKRRGFPKQKRLEFYCELRRKRDEQYAVESCVITDTAEWKHVPMMYHNRLVKIDKKATQHARDTRIGRPKQR